MSLRTRPVLVGVLVLVAVGAPVALGALRTAPGAVPLQVSPGFTRATQGGEQPIGKTRAGKAEPGKRPSQIVTSPRELHLKKAQSAVFDVRSLRGVVVKQERPERRDPNERGGEVDPATAQPQTIDPHSMTARAAAPAPAADSSFDGLDFASWGAGHPPDTNGDVGPTYYIQTVNTSIGIYDKSTGVRVAAFTFNAFMSQGNFGNLCDTNNFGDPVVVYDSFEDRWMITDFAFKLDASGNVVNPPGAFQCFAVSKTADPVAGGWNFYSIAAPGALNDYPKFGVWPDAFYMSANLFGYPANGSYQGYEVWAINKQQMYDDAPSVQVVDFAGDTSDFTVIPANARLQAGTPPVGSPEYFVSTQQFLNAVSIYKLHVDWDRISTSTFTGPTAQQEPTCWPNADPANASTPANSADTLAIRAMAQAQYSNIAGAESVWVSHTVNRGEFSLASCGGTNTNNATVRWYQTNVTGGTVAANVVQGASYDPDGANTFFRFMPALAVDRAGDMALGYTKSSAVTNPQIKYAGRLAGDPANTLGQSEQTLIDGTGAQSGNCGSSACIRWGDYSGMALDPNGCEFWETAEYYATTGLNDLTRIGSFHFPSCTPVGNGTLSGTVTDGVSPIAGATITLGSRRVTTNGTGVYSVSVPAGTYPSLAASKDGFSPSAPSSVTVPDGGTATRNFTLSAAPQSGCFTDNSQATFQRGAPVNCDLTSSPGSVTLASPSTIDQQNSDVSPTGFGFTNTAWAGQTFTPAVTGRLTRVDVALFCSRCTTLGPNVTLSIRNTAGTIPTGADLGSATLAGFNDGGTAGRKTFTFATPVALTAGTRYAFIFRSTATFATGTYAYTCSCRTTGFMDLSPYPNGQFVTSSDSGANWAADTTVVGGRDLNFAVYMNTGFVTSGTFVSSLKDANPAAGATPTWTTLSFTATTPAGTAVKFQAAASNNVNGPFAFVGPDGTAGTFFTTSGASLSQFNGFRYLRYEAFLSTANTTVTPSLSSVSVCFVDQGAATATTLTVDPASGTFGGTAGLKATLTSAGQPVANESIAFKLNGNVAGTASTNPNGVATLSNVSLTGIGAGSYPTGVSAAFAGDNVPNPALAASNGTAALTVAKADQVIQVTQHAPASAVYNTQFTVAATGGASGNAVAFTHTGVCTNVGATYTMTSGTNSCSVTYDQAGSANYNPAPQVVEIVNAAKAAQAITFTSTAPASAHVGDTYQPQATGGGSSSPVVFGATGACSYDGKTGVVTMDSAVSCTVTANQAGDANYNAASQVTQVFAVGKGSQTILVTTHAPGSAVFNTQFTVVATGGASGNPIVFGSSGVCTNVGATYTMSSGTGTCTVTYDQAASANYNQATQVVETVTAAKATQAITFTSTAPTNAQPGDTYHPVANGGGSGNPVVFDANGVCTYNAAGGTVTANSAGLCTVTADQAGNANYNPAPRVTQSYSVGKGAQVILVSQPAPASAVYHTQFTVAATGGASGNPIVFGSSGGCTNVGATYTMTSGTNSCSVTYDQAGSASFNPATQVMETVTAVKAAQAITFTSTAPANAHVGDPYQPQATGGGSSSPVVFGATDACSYNGGTGVVTMDSAGTCLVTANEAGDANYNQAPQASQSFAVGKGSQTILVTQHAPASAVFNTQFTVAATGGASGNPIDFGSSGVCTHVGATYTMTSGTGTCTVTYDQAASANYNQATQVVETVTAAKAAQAITFTSTAPANAQPGDTYQPTATGGGSGNAVVFGASGSCTYNAGTVTANGAGLCTVTADQAGNADYNAAQRATQSYSVGQGAQTIVVTSHAPATAVYNTHFTVAATGGASGNPIVFGSSGVCTNVGATYTMTSGTGTCTVTYDQAGNASFNPATQVMETVTAAKAAQAISFTSTAPVGADVGNIYQPQATGGGSGNPVLFDASGACTYNAGTGTVTANSAGLCTVTADQAGNANYNAAQRATQSYSVGQGTQTIVVTTHAPASAVYSTQFTVAAVGGPSGNPVDFGSSGVCTNVGATYTMTSGTGTCTVTYDQAGNGSYAAAPQVVETVDAAKANQSVSFTSTAPASAHVGDTYQPTATGGASGNAVVFGASGACTWNGGTGVVNVNSIGTCLVTADQAGNDNYNAAPQASQSFGIGKGDQTIAFAPLGDKTWGAADFTVSATATSGLPVSFTAAGDCTVNGATVHLTAAGTCIVTAQQQGDANYNAAAAVPRTFTIGVGTLTITASDRSKLFGQTLVLGTTAFTTSGLAPGDGIASVTLSSAGAAAGAAVGAYPIAVSAAIPAAGTNLANYSLAYVSGTLNVTLAGLIGLDGLSFNGKGSTVDGLANLLSNGDVTIGSAEVHGSVVSTQGAVTLQKTGVVNGDVSAGTTIAGGTITGTQSPNTPLAAFTVSPVAACTPSGDLTVSANKTVTLADGTYCFHDLSLASGAVLQVNGPVKIEVTGQLNANAGSFVNTTGLPSNLQITSSYTGADGVILSGGSGAYLTVFAPGTGVTLSGGAFSGLFLAKSLTVSHDTAVHVDPR